MSLHSFLNLQWSGVAVVVVVLYNDSDGDKSATPLLLVHLFLLSSFYTLPLFFSHERKERGFF